MASTVLATLVVQDGAQQQTLVLASTPATFGRGPDNQIVVAARYVSTHHARIEPEGAAHKITDVGSRNGLLFNGQLVKEHVLADGDVVRVPDPTTASFVSLTYVNPLAPRAAKAAQIAERYAIPPGKPVLTIGRVEADINLDNPQVSRRHAQIELQGGGHVLRDLGATNGTFVGGQRVKGVVPLRPGEVIQIGPFKLIYTGQSLESYDQRGAMRIDGRNLRREVPGAKGQAKKVILNDVSLCIEPREFVALVGGSGAGKSTLMMALSGYLPADSGQVLVNGDDYYKNFDAYRSTLGYVPQDDILHRMLPVDRALGYAARLKLPADTAAKEIDRRVEGVLEAVEMTAHKDKLVDNLSGGQRKRVSIASELLNDPSLLFLDEPTSGLDPGLEKKMMFTLRRLADSGRTVVLVTHATANITQCDHVVFMSAGRMVYFGPPAEALGFFLVTSGDFADIYTKLEGRADPATALVRGDLAEEYAHWRAQNAQAATEPLLAELWEQRYRRSALYQKYVAQRLATTPPGPAVSAQAPASARRAPPKHTPMHQFKLLARRYFDLVLADRKNLGIMLAQAPIIAALLALVSEPKSVAGRVLTGTNPQTGEPGMIILDTNAKQAQTVLFMLSTVAIWFGIINAAREVCKERAIFRRERLADLNVVSYVASKVVVLAALVCVQSAVLLAIVGVRVDWPEHGILFGSWVDLYVSLVFSALAGMCLGLLISALSSTPDKAISVVPLALIPQILFAGLIFDLKDFTEALSWLTTSRWSMDALGSIADLNDMPYQPGARSTRRIAGEALWRFENSGGHLLFTWLVLAAYAALCVYGTILVLQRRRDRG